MEELRHVAAAGGGGARVGLVLEREREHKKLKPAPFFVWAHFLGVGGLLRTGLLSLSLTVDPAEHAAHLLQVAVVEEPDGTVVFILLERNCEWQAGAGREERGGKVERR